MAKPSCCFLTVKDLLLYTTLPANTPFLFGSAKVGGFCFLTNFLPKKFN